VSKQSFSPVSIRRRRKLSVLAALVVLLISCIWVAVASEEGWGWLVILASIAVYAGFQCIALLPMTVIFYRSVSHPIFLGRGWMGFLSCVALGSALGVVGGLILWIFQSSMAPGMYDFMFPIFQGGLIGTFFWLFLSLGLFLDSELEVKESK
jgi:hypothetical protein